jgi:hypothetical protein
MSSEAPLKVDLSKYIEARLFGERPHIRGRRIAVADVAYRARSQNWDVSELAYQWLLVVVLLVAACVPAKTPPQLEFTPGAYARVDDMTYDAGVFRVDYPGGWRIVKNNIAAAPMSVVFVSPDESMTITVQVGALENTRFDGDWQTEIETRTVEGGALVTLIGRAPAEQWDAFQQVFQRVVESVR